MEQVKVLLADDHLIIREGLKIVLEMAKTYKIIGEVSSGDELMDSAKRLEPDLIISDLKMPGVSIIEICPELKDIFSELKIVIFTAYDESDDVYRALQAGIDGYIKKETHPQAILNAVDMVMHGYACFQPKLDRKRNKEEARIQLTEREYEIFQLVIDNLSNQQIAERLCISEATVKTHISSILRKTGQPNRSQAVLFALKEGILPIANR